MAWINPKTNWNPGDGIMAGDLNRIEDNIMSIQRIMRYSYTLGGQGNGLPATPSRIAIVSEADIWHRPGARLFINVYGLFPPNSVAFCMLRTDPPAHYTSDAMFDGAVMGGAAVGSEAWMSSSMVTVNTKYQVYLGWDTISGSGFSSLYANITNIPVEP